MLGFFGSLIWSADAPGPVTASSLGQDRTLSDAFAPPYRGPNDLDRTGRETQANRRIYLQLLDNPAVYSAVDGKVKSVQAKKVVVSPHRAKHPGDKKAADFLNWTVTNTPHGWDGLLRMVLFPGEVYGYSMCRPKTRVIDDHPDFRGLWGLDRIRSLDTENFRLGVDEYRNVRSVVNTVRGLQAYDPDEFLVWQNDALFDNPFGRSSLRPTLKDAQQLDDAFLVWQTAIQLYGAPIVEGKYKGTDTRPALIEALKMLRAGGWLVSHKDDDVKILDLANAVNWQAFEKKARFHEQRIVNVIRGAVLPFTQAGTGDSDIRGDSEVSKEAGSDPNEKAQLLAVSRFLTRELGRVLVRDNFGPLVLPPIVTVGGTDPKAVKEAMDAIDKLIGWRLPVSVDDAYEAAGHQPPNDPANTLKPPQQSGPGVPGQPGDPTAPPADPAAGPAKPPAPDAKPAAPKSTFASDLAPKYADHVAPDRHGRYPGNLHSEFGLEPAAFATATGLVRRHFAAREGDGRWAWVPKPPPEPVTPAPTGPARTFSADHADGPEQWLAEFEGAA